MITGYIEHMYTTLNSTFAGTEIAQTWSALFVFERMFQEYKPDIIIELGTYLGALTHFFSMFAMTYSYDNVNREIKKYPNVNYRIADVFQEEIIREIEKLIIDNNKVFLFCDDGNKPREFNIYSSLLKKGDLIFVHDWNLEIKIEDIESAIKNHNLKSFKKDLCNSYKSILQGWQKGEMTNEFKI